MSDEVLANILKANIEYIINNIGDEYISDFNRNIISFKSRRINSNEANDLGFGIDYNMLGIYNVENNIMYLLSDNLEKIRLMHNDNNNVLSSRLILHELFHMASSKANEYSGVSNINSNNNGLNDGITDLLSFKAYPCVSLIHSGYLYELLLTIQLSLIIGSNELYDSYFKYHNINNIKSSLYRRLSNIDETERFFILLQQYYDNKNIEYLGELQYTLVNSVNKEFISNQFIYNYMKFMITPELLFIRNSFDAEESKLSDSIQILSKHLN